MEKYYVYILYSRKLNRYYIGPTQNIEERLRKHHFSKDHFTGQSDDWELQYTEEYSSRSEAIARESSIKAKKSRGYIEFLIQNKTAGE